MVTAKNKMKQLPKEKKKTVFGDHVSNSLSLSLSIIHFQPSASHCFGTTTQTVSLSLSFMAASMSLRDEAVTSSSLSSSSDPLDSSFLSSEYSLSAPEPSADSDFGFSRPDFAAEPLAGTVDFYDRHVFLCYKNPRVWPPRIAAAEFDRVPRLLSAALSARKPRLKRQVSDS